MGLFAYSLWTLCSLEPCLVSLHRFHIGAFASTFDYKVNPEVLNFPFDFYSKPA